MLLALLLYYADARCCYALPHDAAAERARHRHNRHVSLSLPYDAADEVSRCWLLKRAMPCYADARYFFFFFFFCRAFIYDVAMMRVDISCRCRHIVFIRFAAARHVCYAERRLRYMPDAPYCRARYAMLLCRYYSLMPLPPATAGYRHQMHIDKYVLIDTDIFSSIFTALYAAMFWR